MGALSFTSPLLLAGLLALPVLWYLLRATPPAPQQREFPPFIILRQLTTTKETPHATPWPLLLLRLLLAAAVILGLAGPVLNAAQKSDVNGDIVLFVDDTWAAAQGWNARKDAMRRAAAEAAADDRDIILARTASSRTADDLRPLTGVEARKAIDALTPAPFRADRTAAADRLAAYARDNDLDAARIWWISDGLAGPDDAAIASALKDIGALTVFDNRQTAVTLLKPSGDTAQRFIIERTRMAEAWRGDVVAVARDGRELSRQPVTMAAGERVAAAEIDLPLSLRNEMAMLRIGDGGSAGAVHLVDARSRQALVGLVGEARPANARLLSGSYYIGEALSAHAEIIEGRLSDLLDSDVTVIVLDDIGRLRASEIAALTAWVEAGGVVIRFAGPVLAEAAQDGDPPLLPVSLRGGGRAFGGALTWETPQRLTAFDASGPFAGMTPPSDVFVRRQVLAQPGGETTDATWARLADGTPLVTGTARGKGAVALFHVAATPEWSDLPISGAFVDMLRRLTFLSEHGPQDAEAETAEKFAPLRQLDGFGRLRRPDDAQAALSTGDIAEGPSPLRPPGLYGPPEAPLALNAVSPDESVSRLSLRGTTIVPYDAAPPRLLSVWLFAAAFAMLMIDVVAVAFLAGAFRKAAPAAGALAVALLVFAPHNVAEAQPLDPAIEADAAEAALLTRLAFVRTGDGAIDRLSEQALIGLSRELARRTAIEPGPPAGVDPQTDDLSVYPFLYWPIVAGAEAPSDAALANLENFMRFGGLIVFDTRDDERAVAPGSTPESQALQRIVGQLNIPPLTPVDPTHVLTRSFYLLPDLFGRTQENPVWVQDGATGANDGVTPVIIGGRDWAGAWAVDSFGRPVRPMARGGRRARELAYRAGVNMVMVAFTGNYKSDQVHTPVLLERLGR